VNIDRLKRQIVNELKSNPKKSGALAVLLLVGCYFWIPLMFSGDDKAPRNVAPKDGAIEVPPLPGAVAIAGNTAKEDQGEKLRYPWDELAAAMDRDSRRLSMALSVSTHNPFDAERLREEETATKEVETDTTQHEVTPESANLVLSSTIVSARRSMALINGKIYSTGDQVETEDGVVFTLRKVESRSIILQRGNRQYVLAIADVSGSGQIDVGTEE
jgi:hypothetical protein